METIKMSEKEYADLCRIVRRVSFFGNMTIGQIELILPYITLWKFLKGEEVFRQDEPGDSFYILHEGEVSVRVKKGFFSLSKKVAMLGPGSFFGEMALLAREPRNASIICEKDSRIFALSADDFEGVRKNNLSFAAEIKKIAAERKNTNRS
ncbi:MAG: cyclic nucleotide-binding domain-containing protein [bacterium]